MPLREYFAAWWKGEKGGTKPRAASLAVLLGAAAMALIVCSELWPAPGGGTGAGEKSGQKGFCGKNAEEINTKI